MGLLERITESSRRAQKGGDAVRLGVLRFLIAQIRNREIEKQVKDTGLPEEEVFQVLQKEAKKRREAMELFMQGGRNDLKDKEAVELVIIEEYLPAQLSREDVVKVVAELRVEGASDVNGLMKAAMARLKGQADGKLVREVIEEQLK